MSWLPPIHRPWRAIPFSLATGAFGVALFWGWLGMLAMDNPGSRAAVEHAKASDSLNAGATVVFVLGFLLPLRWTLFLPRR